MRQTQENFDDKCYELQTLRWFRDNFVSDEDIKHYYKIAPIIVEAINERNDNNEIYNYIYENVVSSCVDAINSENYEFAYNRYKNSILTFEEVFAKPYLQKKIVKVLKYKVERHQ